MPLGEGRVKVDNLEFGVVVVELLLLLLLLILLLLLLPSGSISTEL